MIDCITFEKFVSEYLEGTLPPRSHIVFKIHLLACRECRTYLKEYENTILLARSQKDIGYSDMGMGPVPEDLIKAVLAAQHAASEDKPKTVD